MSARVRLPFLTTALWVFVFTASASAAQRLTSGAAVLDFRDGGVAVGVYRTRAPAVVTTSAGQTVAAAYDRVTVTPDRVVATATVTTPDGARFAFVDTWTPVAGDAFRLCRRVGTDDRRDSGFDTRFLLTLPGVTSAADAELFAPGVWYRHNDHVVPRAIGADKSLGTYLVKETRLALPMVAGRPDGVGPALSVVHADARPATPLDDYDPAAQTDAAITYGSLGYDGGAIGFCYPGTEATVSYGAPGPRLRFHPIAPGVTHAYDLIVRVGPGGAFPDVMADAWRHAAAAYTPVIWPADASLYAAGLATFARYYREDFPHGGRGLPFMVFLGLHAPASATVAPRRRPARGRATTTCRAASWECRSPRPL